MGCFNSWAVVAAGCAVSAGVTAAGEGHATQNWYKIPMHQHPSSIALRNRRGKVPLPESKETSSLNSTAHRAPAAGHSTHPVFTASGRQVVPSGASLYGWPTAAYHIDLMLGTPPQPVRLVVDTGSSNLAVAGPDIASSFTQLQSYNPELSSTAEATGQTFSLEYVVGEIDCAVYTDIIAVQNGTGVAYLHASVSFGVITSQKDFFSDSALARAGVYDGILGLAYRNLASDSLVPLFQALVNQQHIANVFAMELCQPTDAWILAGKPTGFLTLGWTPSETSTLYTRLLHEEYYGVEVAAMAVGGTRLPLGCKDYNAPALSIVDSGTTDLLVPTKVFAAIVTALRATPGLAGLPANDLDQYFSSNENDRLLIPTALFRFFPTMSMFFAINATHEFEVRMSPQNYLHNQTDNYGRAVGHTFGVSPICLAESGITIGMSLLTATLVEYNRETKAIGFSNVSADSCPNQPPAVFGPNLVPRGTYTGSCIDTGVHCSPQPNAMQEGLLFGIGVGCGVLGLGLLIYAFVCVRVPAKPEPRRQRRWWHVCCGRKRARSTASATSAAGVTSDDDDDALLDFAEDGELNINGDLDIPLTTYEDSRTD